MEIITAVVVMHAIVFGRQLDHVVTGTRVISVMAKTAVQAVILGRPLIGTTVTPIVALLLRRTVTVIPIPIIAITQFIGIGQRGEHTNHPDH